MPYLYILKSGNLYKIGYTTDWKNRSKAYNTHNPHYKLVKIISHPKAYELEQVLLNTFKKRKKHRDWYKLTLWDRLKIKFILWGVG